MSAQPIEAVCLRDYRAVHTSGKRAVAGVRWIVLHDQESPTAEGAARWFANPRSRGSAHLCVDGDVCYRTLGNDDVPWAAYGANVHGFHIEQAGFAKWSAVVWLRHVRTLRRAAYKTAVHCVVFNIPPRFVFAADLTAGRDGVTTHCECTRAFGGTHTDPGRFWPRRRFMRLVREYHAALSV